MNEYFKYIYALLRFFYNFLCCLKFPIFVDCNLNTIYFYSCLSNISNVICYVGYKYMFLTRTVHNLKCVMCNIVVGGRITQKPVRRKYYTIHECNVFIFSVKRSKLRERINWTKHFIDLVEIRCISSLSLLP